MKLRGRPGRLSLASMPDELAKLGLVRGIALLTDLFVLDSPRELLEDPHCSPNHETAILGFSCSPSRSYFVLFWDQNSTK